MVYAPLLPRTPGAGFVIAAMPYKRQKIAIVSSGLHVQNKYRRRSGTLPLYPRKAQLATVYARIKAELPDHLFALIVVVGCTGHACSLDRCYLANECSHRSRDGGTTIVSPVSGWPMFSSLVYAVKPGLPKSSHLTYRHGMHKG